MSPSRRRRPEPPLIVALHHDDGVRDFLRRALCRYGYRVSVSSDLQEALGILEQERPHLVLYDPELRGAYGLELLPQVLRASRSTRVVVLGPDLERSEIVQAMRLGVAGVVTAICLQDRQTHRKQRREDRPGQSSG
ncbi:MAG: response regulator [Candidatus Latescibacterota bacterium]